MDNPREWLRIIFAVVFFGGWGVAFAIAFFAIVDEETRRQQAAVAEAVARARRAKAKKASLARVKARKRAWHNRRDELFTALSRSGKGTLQHQCISELIREHLAQKP